MNKKETLASFKQKEEQRIQATLDFIKEMNFQKREDKLAEYSKASDVYALPLSGQKYLVLNHYNPKRKIELQGFDLWLSDYKNTTDIGVKKAISIDSIKLSFNYSRDKEILTEYLLAK